MFRKVLLAYDSSEETAAALSQAADLARLYKAELSLIGIIEGTPSTALAEPYSQQDLMATERSRIEQAMLTEARKLGSRDLKVTTEILEGDPAKEIAAYAKRIGADLIVIGHADKGFLARWFEGSTGVKLTRELPCSLLIATGK